MGYDLVEKCHDDGHLCNMTREEEAALIDGGGGGDLCELVCDGSSILRLFED